MILRLFYILIIITGVALFIKGMDYGKGMLYGLKFLAGILVIGMMEMTLVKKKKENHIQFSCISISFSSLSHFS